MRKPIQFAVTLMLAAILGLSVAYAGEERTSETDERMARWLKRDRKSVV